MWNVTLNLTHIDLPLLQGPLWSHGSFWEVHNNRKIQGVLLWPQSSNSTRAIAHQTELKRWKKMCGINEKPRNKMFSPNLKTEKIWRIFFSFFLFYVKLFYNHFDQIWGKKFPQEIHKSQASPTFFPWFSYTDIIMWETEGKTTTG